MCLETRRGLMIAIDSLELEMEQRQPRREFYRHGYREFFGSVSHEQETDKDLYIEFIRYFCFDSEDGAFNGFQEPWVILMTECGSTGSPVWILDADQFRERLKALLGESATWDEFHEFLDNQLVERT